jgi:hypothetical protein
MRSNDAHRIQAITKSDFATTEDFGKLFTDDMNSLYLLSFLLTASHERAEECVVAGLDECVEGNFVIREWAHSWARRMLIRNAIRIVAPHADDIKPTSVALHSTGTANLRRIPLGDSPFAGVLELEDFERFVFVLSVLERYIDHNCAILLGTTKRIVQETRIRALMRIGDTSDVGASGPKTGTLC